MENKNFTRLTLEQSNLKLTWEVPYEDVNTEELMNAIKTIMVGMTFHPDTVERMCVNYLEETEKYNVYTVEDEEDPNN